MRTSFMGCTWERCVSVGNAKNYAYGMKIAERSWGKDARYQYNGKEQDKGMGRYNFDGRMYDERSCRWMSLDPQAAKYAGISPYVGFNNNPIMFVDPDGEEIIIQVASNGNTPGKTIRFNKDGSLSEKTYKTVNNQVVVTYTNYVAPAGSYEANVQAQLNYLRTMDNEEIKKRMSVLQSATNQHIIKDLTLNEKRQVDNGYDLGDENSGDKDSHITKWDEYGTSVGSVTRHDASDWNSVRGDKRPPVVVLAHELLGHGYNKEIGKNNRIQTGKMSVNKKPKPILYEEVMAVRVENIVRAYMHKEFENSKRQDIFNNTYPRTTYGGMDIQPELSKLDKEKIGFPQPQNK